MKSVKAIINEEILGFREGVGDAYAERRFGIPDTQQRDYLRQTAGRVHDDMGKMIGYAGNRNQQSPIYMNPRNLKNFEPDVRAITDVQGNLYVAQLDADLIHANILNLLKASDDFQFQPWIRAGRTTGFKSAMGGMMTRENQSKSFQNLREKQPYGFW